jgi:hypothetical protein
MTRKTHMTKKMHKKMPIRHTRKQRRSGGGFLDWFIRPNPQPPVYGPQPQSFNPQQQSSNWYGNPMQSMRQGFNQFSQPMSQGFNRFGQGVNQFGQSVGQGFNQFGQALGQGYNRFGQGVNQFGQALGQGYNRFGQGVNQFGQALGQGYNQFGQTLGQGVNQFGQTVGQYNPITYASNVFRNYQSNPANPALPYQGGKIKRRIMKGGYQDNISVTGLASTAAPFSGPTAQPHQMVGGKTRKGGKKVGKKGGKTHRNKK